MQVTKYKRDKGLIGRMYLTMILIAGIYAGFGLFLWQIGLAWFYVVPIIMAVSLLQWWFSDRLILGATRAKVVTEKEEPELHRMVDKLCARSGLPKPKLAVINTPTPNAFATGRSRSRSVVAVTTGLRRILNEQELEGVLAHELGHIRHRDISVLALANFFVAITSFFMAIFFWSALFGGGRRSTDGAGAIMLAYLVTILVYFIGQLLVMALTRHREYLADHAGAELSGNPRALATALYKIRFATDKVPQEALSQLSTARAFCILPAAPRGDIASAFSTHPPVEKRIDRLLSLERKRTPADYTYNWQSPK